MRPHGADPSPPPPAVPVLQMGVAGPRGEDGFLLRAPRSEALAWDIENEVLSPRRAWIQERCAWWIAACYLDAVIEMVLRSFPAVRVQKAEGAALVSREGWRSPPPRPGRHDDAEPGESSKRSA